MRIGFITGEYPPLQGGVGAYTDKLAQILSKQGHTVFILSEKRTQQQHDDILLTHLKGKWGFTAFRQINHWAELYKLDMISLQFQTAAYEMSPWVHFLSHFVRTPIVTTFHDLRFPYLFPKAGKLRDWIVQHLAVCSEGVIVTNYDDYQRVKHLPNTAVIPIGSTITGKLPPDYDRSSWRKQYTESDSSFLLGFFGFINHSKGVDILLNALAYLNDPQFRLVMIGDRTGTADPTNRTYAGKIDDLISKLRLTEQVSWTGYVSDQEVIGYLHAVDAVVLPFLDGASYRRSSLITAIEQGCAIITTEPSHPTSAFSEDTMLLVPPNDADSLAKAIQKVSNTPSLRTKLKEGATKLKQAFDWEKIAQDNAALFHQVIRELAR